MASDREGNLGKEQVAVPEQFAVSEAVWAGVREWNTALRLAGDDIGTVRRTCISCGQSINVAWNNRGVYEYTGEQLDGLVLAHLIQTHGWTRETCGE